MQILHRVQDDKPLSKRSGRMAKPEATSSRLPPAENYLPPAHTTDRENKMDIDPIQGPKFLYPARVALAALRSLPKSPDKPGPTKKRINFHS
jgi:hypothetical protein